MTWWRRRKREPASPETVEARQGLEQAHQDLAAALADDDQVERVADRLNELRRRNHFGPMITRALKGTR
ncbi:hypothetical protein [Micromonospora sp. NPDC023956]|uniref:DUF7620 family protein n=1 Tax=Micromonospora sp. NPDC023956 TaxID=3155722 RepID=UPI0033FA4860